MKKVFTLILISGTTLCGCATQQQERSPQATGRPLWAATIHSEVVRAGDRNEMEKLSHQYSEVLRWEKPGYKPVRDQLVESRDAWRAMKHYPPEYDPTK